MKFKDFLAERLPKELYNLLPSHAKLIDRVALLRFPEELDEHEEEIGRLALEFYRVRAVYRIYGVEGVERRPILKHLAGEEVEEVIHREYGCIFKLNLRRLMFCLGNSFERLRTAALIGRGEVVIDMFAGIGQFTIPIAVFSAPSRIYSIEINPEAYGYLQENIKLNRVEGIVESIMGDCRRIVEEKLRGKADHVIMGYFWKTSGALPQALHALKPHGGVIHFHDLARRGREEEFIEKILEKVREEGYTPHLLRWRKVKSYSKTRNHIVIDFYAVREGSL